VSIPLRLERQQMEFLKDAVPGAPMASHQHDSTAKIATTGECTKVVAINSSHTMAITTCASPPNLGGLLLRSHRTHDCRHHPARKFTSTTFRNPSREARFHHGRHPHSIAHATDDNGNDVTNSSTNWMAKRSTLCRGQYQGITAITTWKSTSVTMLPRPARSI